MKIKLSREEALRMRDRLNLELNTTKDKFTIDLNDLKAKKMKKVKLGKNSVYGEMGPLPYIRPSKISDQEIELTAKILYQKFMQECEGESGSIDVTNDMKRFVDMYTPDKVGDLAALCGRITCKIYTLDPRLVSVNHQISSPPELGGQYLLQYFFHF